MKVGRWLVAGVAAALAAWPSYLLAEDYLARINADVAEILKTPDFQEVLARQGATSLTSSPEEFGNLLRKDIAKWARTVKAAGVKMN
jgi:tripartite-type tricarboxylate transporter receptor subunit TctC